ncbi:MAG: hypothetical protein HKN82_01580 [Akkermansiaceae bacterium]|nr:hypothetical protein [Akkermansiaceae bacterium]
MSAIAALGPNGNERSRPAGGADRPAFRSASVILNRQSGGLLGGDPDVAAAGICERLQAAGVSARPHLVPPRELANAIEEALAEDTEALVVGGGDGTVRSVANRMLAGGHGTGKMLGILPLGTFNGLARDLGLGTSSGEALEQILRARATPMDVAFVNDHLMLIACLLGPYVALARMREECRGLGWFRGSSRMIPAWLRAVFSSAKITVDIQDDHDLNVRARSRLIAITNNIYRATPQTLPRRLRIDENIMEIFISRHRSPWGLLRAGLDLLGSRWRDNPGLDYHRARRLEINSARGKRLPAMIDGEVVTLDLPLRCSLRPAALRILRPETPGPDPDSQRAA